MVNLIKIITTIIMVAINKVNRLLHEVDFTHKVIITIIADQVRAFIAWHISLVSNLIVKVSATITIAIVMIIVVVILVAATVAVIAVVVAYSYW